MKNSAAASRGMLLFAACLCSLAAWHCAATIKPPALAKAPGCVTSLSGFYEHSVPWPGQKPALIMRKAGEYKIIHGKVISQTGQGVTFDPEREGAFYDPKPEFFAFDKLEAFIAEDGRLVAGAIPAKLANPIALEIHLKEKNRPGAKPYRLRLEPNAAFGYCLPAGTYEVSAIAFRDRKGNIDLGVDYPKLEIALEHGRVNYLGHLRLGRSPAVLRDSVLIPIKIGARPGGAMAAGILGGAIGGALHAAALASKGVIGAHLLYFGESAAPATRGKSQPKYAPLKVSE